jgi:hypothetical protein
MFVSKQMSEVEVLCRQKQRVVVKLFVGVWITKTAQVLPQLDELGSIKVRQKFECL